MPASWLSAVNAALPYVEALTKVALPAFGARRARDDADPRIAELETAARHNAEHIRELATQLEASLRALDQAAAATDAALRRQRRMLALCGLGTTLALALALAALLR
jgi:hypothetical protein